MPGRQTVYTQTQGPDSSALRLRAFLMSGDWQDIVKGKQAVDVWKMIEPLAETAAEVAVKIARNPDKKITEIIKPDKMIYNGAMAVPTIVTPVKLVTKDNINETLIKGGVYTKNQIYGGEPISENLR